MPDRVRRALEHLRWEHRHHYESVTDEDLEQPGCDRCQASYDAGVTDGFLGALSTLYAYFPETARAMGQEPPQPPQL